MPCCSIINCSNNTKKKQPDRDISFHRFPDNPKVKRKWIEATGRKDWYPSQYSRICSIHFHEDTFTGITGTSKYRRIISTAYPTIDTVKMTNDEKVDFKRSRVPSQDTSSSTSTGADSPKAEDPDTSESEVETDVVKIEPDDSTNEEEEVEAKWQRETAPIEAEKPKVDHVRTREKRIEDLIQKSVSPSRRNPDLVLLPDNFLRAMLRSQREIVSTVKSQVLMQNPDPTLLTFLRFVGAKLQMLSKGTRKKLVERATAMILKEYDD